MSQWYVLVFVLFVPLAVACMLAAGGSDTLCDRIGRVGPEGRYMLYRCENGSLFLHPVGPIPKPEQETST